MVVQRILWIQLHEPEFLEGELNSSALFDVFKVSVFRELYSTIEETCNIRPPPPVNSRCFQSNGKLNNIICDVFQGVTPSPVTGVVRVSTAHEMAAQQQSANMIDDSSFFRRMPPDQRKAKFCLKAWSKEPLTLQKLNTCQFSKGQSHLFPKFKVSMIIFFVAFMPNVLDVALKHFLFYKEYFFLYFRIGIWQ